MVRHQKGDSSYWLLPGGGVDYGETLQQALVRELKEEASVTIEVGDLLMLSDSIGPDNSRHLVQCAFSATIVDGDEVVLGIDPRVVEARYVSRDELKSLPIHPPLNAELLEGLKEGFTASMGYLGNRWLDRPVES